MIYSLTQELEDLLAVTYVMNAMLYILENEEATPSPMPSQLSSPAPRPVPFPSPNYINQTYIQNPEPRYPIQKKQPVVIPSEMEISLQSLTSALSSTEATSPQDPTGSRQMAASQTAPLESNDIQISPAMQLNLEETQLSPPPVFSQAIQIQGHKEPLLVAANSGNRILTKLLEENADLSEQVGALEQMNDRMSRRLKDLEAKVKSFQRQEEEQAKRSEELERLKNEDEIKTKTLADLLVKMEDTQIQLTQKTTNHKESAEQLEKITKKLLKEQKKVEVLENEIKNYLTDQPNVEDFEILKNYLHPEMEKYAVDVVKDAFGPRGLRGDAAAAFVSKYFDELYGTHWQAILFRSDGHGCLVQHNNNCYILFRLGNYEFLLFRY